MYPPNCVLMSLFLMIADGFTVRGPSAPLSAPLGSSVVLPCYVDEALPVEDLEVEWRRADSETLIHLYQDGESQPEVQQQDYHDRAHFFTEEIQHGNFSLRLDNLTAQDEGEYRCRVHSQQDSGETVAQIKDVERLLVSGSEESISAYVGEDVTLNCSVDSHITPEHIEVSWIKTDGDILVLLYENNETLPDSSHERYKDRVELFTAEIPKGNFSLRLKSVRTEDKGVYMCQVFAGGLSASVTVELGGLGLSALHIIMMILCISASGSALLLCFMIYCRSPSKGFFVQQIYNRSFYVGSSVVLHCHVDRSLLKKIQKVEWRRKNTKTLVHMYQDGEVQQQDYHDRAHFFTDEIQHGNFSLRLDNLRAEDAGEYTCTVYSDRFTVIRTAEIKLAPEFAVKGSSGIKTVLMGSSIVLPCQVDKPLLQRNLKVEWRRNSETLVHLYQDGKSQPNKQHKDYHNRAHFILKKIKEGNCSLRLKKLKAEDAGKYTCKVYSDQECVHSEEADVIIPETVFCLQMFLMFFPNILMFLAFVLWGFSEGSLIESVSCCALYLLRPLMLLWAAPYIKEFKGNMKAWILYYSYETEYIAFSAVFYSVLFKSAWDKSLNYTGFERVVIIVLFVIVLLLTLIYIIYLLTTFIGKLSERIEAIFDFLAGVSLDVLPSLQFILLFFAFGSARAGFFIVAVLPVFLTVTNYDWDLTCGEKMGCLPSVMRSVWLILMLLINAVMVYFYIMALENEKDRVGWACMIAFLQLLWAVTDFTRTFEFDLHRVDTVYVFGSVVVVLLNSVTLMTELILKTVNGEGAVGDLRIVVFSSEFIFTFFLLVLMVFEPWIKTCQQSCQKARKSRQTPAAESQNAAVSVEPPVSESNQSQRPTESVEMRPLLNQDQQASGSENQPDSVVSQA
ncbi:uncharacterized protein LOC130220840 isoform X2 [Danio aesculapii]|uniref:uncharacterized protein LOC130220840 isoform X2 n=1 Tax=Danio aesculapii TaxID=1142201 RepID=UPI0024C0A86B|nr:uncharacterized protein LOC130220840 isoform X2 [Danio aesculapii]